MGELDTKNGQHINLTGKSVLSDAAQRAGEIYDRLILDKVPEAAFLEGKPSPFVWRVVNYYLGASGLVDLTVDMGCGAGRQLPAQLSASNLVVGFDPSQVSLAIANQRFDHLKKAKDPNRQFNHASFRLGDMETFVDNNIVREGEVDALFAISVINHATHDVIKRTYDQVQRSLKPGGYFFFTMISKNNPQYQPGVMDKGDLPQDEETFYPKSGIDGEIAHHFSDEQELNDDLTAAGFQVLELEEDRTGEDIGGRSGGHWIIVARKPLPEGVEEIRFATSRKELHLNGNGNGTRKSAFLASAGHMLRMQAAPAIPSFSRTPDLVQSSGD